MIFLHDVLHRLGLDMATASGASSYYALNAFERRDALVQAVSTIVGDFGADILTAPHPNGNPDLKALVDALRPHAGMIIEATV